MPEWRPWQNDDLQQDKMLIFDTQDEGGIRMSSEHGSRQQVLDHLADDPRVRSVDKLCRLYRDILEHSHTFLTLGEYNVVEGGLCT